MIGILAALKLSPIIIGILQDIIKTSPAVTFLLGVVITFIGVMALIRFIGKKLEDLLEAVNINFINKLAGGAVQGLFFAYIMSLALWLVNNLNVLNPETKAASITYPFAGTTT
ncbi:MAG: CvpA family protein [Saprospiraceae bacterium]|nr:CvpA family protein [Saprospiraceae bacterium]